MAKKPIAKKKAKKNIVAGVVHINATYNNTIITITDVQGNVVCWSSAGKMGFKGSRKSTPYVGQVAAEDCGRIAQEHGMKELDIRVKGPGSGRESAVRALYALGFKINKIMDITPIPHNGVRAKKKRRV